MADRKVMNRQIEDSEDSQRSTERLAGLIRSRKTGPQSSTEMEMLAKIARDSVLNLERVARVVSGFERTVLTAVRTEDPFAAYVQGVLGHVETGRSPENALEVVHKREADGLSLNVNQFIQDVARSLPIENDLLDKGGSGCALLSVSSTDVAANRPGSGSGHKGRTGKGLHRAFLAIRSIIRGHNGSIRILRQKGALQFNIYLPVLRET
jgi:hypothetical protein